jgi:four helix bundle protein
MSCGCLMRSCGRGKKAGLGVRDQGLEGNPISTLMAFSLRIARQGDGVRKETALQVKSYQDLIAWQKAISLVTEIYGLTAQFPANELYGLRSQLRRASVSIPSNIAEGHGRATKGEYIQFLGHARGSLCEVQTQIFIAHRLGYVPQEQKGSVIAMTDELGRILNGLIASIQGKKLKPLASLIPNL